MCWIEIERISFLLGPWPYWRSMNVFIFFRAIALLLHWSSSLALDRRHMWLQVKFGAFSILFYVPCQRLDSNVDQLSYQH